jgi:hypothetical protein
MADQILFDKLVYMDRLTRAGISEEQARAQAEALHESLRESVATKSDIALVKSDIALVRSDFRVEIAALKQDLTVRMGIVAATLFAALAAIKFFG